MKIFNKIQYIILYIISLFIIGITSLITGDLGWGQLQSATFYIQQALTYAAIICVIIATLLMIIDKFKSTDDEYKKCEEIIKNFAEKTYIPSIFSRYCEHVNLQRKERQLIYNIKKKLHRLEQKAKESDIYAWNNNKEQAIKDGNKYCVNRANLEKMLSSEWIKENLDTANVRYDRITSSVILGGRFSQADNFSVNDFITKYKAAKVARDKLPMILLSFGITSFISSIIMDFSFNATAVVTILTKILVLCFNTFMTIRYANNYTQTVTLFDIRFRKGITQEYNKWLQQEAKQQSEQIQTNESDALYDSMKKEAAERVTDDLTGIKKMLYNSPVGLVADAITVIKEKSNDRAGNAGDTETHNQNS